MNKILQIVFVVVGVLVLAGGVFFAGTFLGARLNQPAGNFIPGLTAGRGGQAQNQTGPGGMMNGGARGGREDNNQPGAGQGYGAGPGGMMGGYGNGQANLTPVTVDEAKTAAQSYLTTLNISGLEIGDVTIIDSSAHVVVKETDGGNGAFELIVDPRSKTAHPDGGANVMWNLKYGGVLQAAMPIGGRGPMMGGTNGANATPAATSAAPAATPANVSADMPITAAQAVTAAQSYLDTAFPGATAAATPLKFYGYYSLSFSKDGAVVGVLSVNGFNGQVLPDMPRGMFGQGRP